MNLPSSVRVAYEPLRSLAFGNIGGAYVGVGTPFENPIRIIHISNNTDADLFISFNGIDDHDFVAVNSFILVDYGSNKSDQAGFLEGPAGERLYVKADPNALPTAGSIYAAVIYAAQQ